MKHRIADYAALLFDLDGTLVDTMPLHYEAYRRAFAMRDLILPEATFMAHIGGPARDVIPRLLAAVGAPSSDPRDSLKLHQDKKHLFGDVLSTVAPRALPASRLITAAHGRRPLGLVSSGNGSGVAAIVTRMNWQDHFDVIVSGDDVGRGKPDPEPYLKAAAALGVAPSCCLVLEDSADGIASGRAAGMTVIDTREPWDFE